MKVVILAVGIAGLFVCGVWVLQMLWALSVTPIFGLPMPSWVQMAALWGSG